MAERTGSCLCGGITYRLTGKSIQPVASTICHCLNCRRWTGSAFVTGSTFLRAGFEITKGADKLKTYDDYCTDSGHPLHRSFCGGCGSNLFAATPLYEQLIIISAGSLDDSQDWRPDVEQYCGRRLGWVQRCEGVDASKRFVGNVRSEIEGNEGTDGQRVHRQRIEVQKVPAQKTTAPWSLWSWGWRRGEVGVKG